MVVAQAESSKRRARRLGPIFLGPFLGHWLRWACILKPGQDAGFRFASFAVSARQERSRKRGLVDGTRDAESVSIAMKDLLFVIVTSAFFAVAWLYARSCEKI